MILLIFECRNETERRSFLEAHLAWFDRAQAEREAAMEAIIGIQSEVKQYDAIDEVRRQSLPFRYKEIEDQLDEGLVFLSNSSLLANRNRYSDTYGLSQAAARFARDGPTRPTLC